MNLLQLMDFQALLQEVIICIGVDLPSPCLMDPYLVPEINAT
mgnify:CR=1 FL=1